MQRRMSVTLRDYRFFRSFSAKIENWPRRKAEALWRKMRERKIAGTQVNTFIWLRLGGDKFFGKFDHFSL